MDGDADAGVGPGRAGTAILTPDQRVRVFVSSTMEELAEERAAARAAVEGLHLAPILFELGARAHPPQSLYRSYLEQSHVFVGIYWQRYGWVAPGMEISGLEDEYLLAGERPKLIYVKRPAPDREERLEDLLDRIRSDDDVSYKGFTTAEELRALVADDLSVLLSEAFLFDETVRVPAHPRFTLPGDTTTFIGREKELGELSALLARDDVRLVTLTGPGGIGKTRLALRAATAAAPRFDEGAAFVSLASLRDTRLIPAAIAAAVGLRDSAVNLDALKADLADRSLLLVIDNFEQLMAAADLIPALLESAPRVKVLATSREALRVQAEREFPVPPLASIDSMRMFADRAAAVRHGFHIDDANAVIIDRICRRLEGVPLAIELAAARIRLLSPETLLERLDSRLEFLTGGPRDLPERQQALRNTIEWSYDLLDEHERRLFDRLGVFAGGFSLAAAEKVGVNGDGFDVLDVAASLVDKSLLRAEPTATEPRFRMLEMIAEFARGRLRSTDSEERVRQRHAEFYRDLSVSLGTGIRGPDQRKWLEVIGDNDTGETSNLRAALAWFIEHRRLDDFADMAWALWVPAWINGRIEEGWYLTRSALGAGATMSERSRARVLVVYGMFSMWRGVHDEAVPALAEGLEIARSLGDDEVAAAATLASSMIAGPSEGEERAERLAEDTLALYDKLGDTWGEAAALNVLGWLYVTQERFDGAEAVLRRTLEISREVGDEQFSAMAEVNLAELLLHRDDVEGATALLASCVNRHRSVRLTYSVAYLLETCARLAAHKGDASRAVRLVAAASHLRDAAGVSVWGSQLVRRDRFVDQLREALGTERFDTESAIGAGLCYADALDATSLLG